MKNPLVSLGTFALTLQQLCSEGVSTTLNPLFCSSSSSSSSSDWYHGSSGHFTTHRKPKLLCLRKNTYNIKLSGGYKLWQGRGGGNHDWRDDADRGWDYGYQHNEKNEEYYVEDGPYHSSQGKQAQPQKWYFCCVVDLCLNSRTAAAELVF